MDALALVRDVTNFRLGNTLTHDQLAAKRFLVFYDFATLVALSIWIWGYTGRQCYAVDRHNGFA